jgi:hypothetical protein
MIAELTNKVNLIIDSNRLITEKINNIKKDLYKYETVDKAKTLENKLKDLYVKINEINNKTNQKDMGCKEINIVWIKMRNKSIKPIYLTKVNDRWIGQFGEIYEKLPTEKELKILYNKSN